jgi:hypothetical protein
MSACTLESAIRLLVHARNSHGALKARIRAAIRSDIVALRLLRAGLPEVIEA